jgi:hypothetical protein
MMFNRGRRGKIKPIGLSVAAAALTAIAFAAVSVAQDDGGKSDGSKQEGARDGATFEHRIGPPPELSEEQEQQMEEFRQCMEDQGAPAPPRPGELEDGERPEPPSEEERETIHEALEACEGELPEGVRPPGPPCGPPPGAEGRDGEEMTLPAPPQGAPGAQQG